MSIILVLILVVLVIKFLFDILMMSRTFRSHWFWLWQPIRYPDYFRALSKSDHKFISKTSKEYKAYAKDVTGQNVGCLATVISGLITVPVLFAAGLYVGNSSLLRGKTLNIRHSVFGDYLFSEFPSSYEQILFILLLGAIFLGFIGIAYLIAGFSRVFVLLPLITAGLFEGEPPNLSDADQFLEVKGISGQPITLIEHMFRMKKFNANKPLQYDREIQRGAVRRGGNFILGAIAITAIVFSAQIFQMTKFANFYERGFTVPRDEDDINRVAIAYEDIERIEIICQFDAENYTYPGINIISHGEAEISVRIEKSILNELIRLDNYWRELGVEFVQGYRRYSRNCATNVINHDGRGSRHKVKRIMHYEEFRNK